MSSAHYVTSFADSGADDADDAGALSLFLWPYAPFCFLFLSLCCTKPGLIIAAAKLR